MVWCLLNSESLSSVLLQRRQHVKRFCVYSITEVVSQPCCRKVTDQMVWCLQYSRGFISVLLQRRQQIRWFGDYSTAEVLSQSCCREDSRSDGLAPTAQQRFYFSLAVEETADQMVQCLQHSRGFISALLQRRQQIKWFSVYSTVEVLSQPCCRENSRSNGSVSTTQWRSHLSLVVEKATSEMLLCLQHYRGCITALGP